MKVTTLIFDFDGTIADSLESVVNIFNRLANSLNLKPIDQNDIERLRGLSAREILKLTHISPLKVPLLALRWYKELGKEIETIPPIKGIPKTLQALNQKNINLGIATSNSPTNVKNFLIKNNLDFFKFIHSENTLFGKGKVIKKALSKYRLNPDNVIYVGDEIRDIEAARDAKILIAAVTWGFNNRSSLKKNEPDFLIDKPSELLKLTN